MKHLALVSLLLTAVIAVSAQDSTTKKKKDWSKIALTNRSNDHFMIQYGWLGWKGTPDTVNTRGWSRSFKIGRAHV